MYAGKTIYFSIFLSMVLALTRKEAEERIKEQMISISKGYKLTYNTSLKDEQFMNTIKDEEPPNAKIFDRKDYAGASLTHRNEYRCLEREERNNLYKALNKMKETRTKDYSLTIYDLIVRSHNSDLSPTAHYTPSFLPWHRHHLKLTETEVQLHCYRCGIPYWDTRLDRRAVVDARESIIFTEDFAGNGQGVVKNGFAKNWNIVGEECRSINSRLYRNVEQDPNYFFTDAMVNKTLASTSFNDLSCPWNEDFEFAHGMIHLLCGGHMESVLCSPNDPLFFFHHVFVDYVFVKWLKKMSGNLRYDEKKPYEGIDEGNKIRILSALKNRMLPFDVSHHYAFTNDYGVTYDQSPADVVCNSDSDCCENGNTEFIFCDDSISQCVSKVAEGALLRPNFPLEACYCPFPMSPFRNVDKCACK